MPRSRRYQFENAFYHVFNRGNARKTIFFSELDFHIFLHHLAIASERFNVRVHSFCLMKNHYHLLLETPDANLSKMMQSLMSNFSRHINKTIKSDGALFRDRFRSIVVDSDAYLLQLSRYIHQNPVKAGYVTNPLQYKWSSFPLFFEKKPSYPFLKTSCILAYFKSPDEYFDYVSLGVDPAIERFYSKKYVPSILGSEQFVHKLKALASDS